ncbi:MAG TPA: NifU family protein [Acidimicrobiales bacterium]|jgi:Fe/S biogenesis protein NfuA|nr:NifU family protein [Acidimicrobiales bacterium]
MTDTDEGGGAPVLMATDVALAMVLELRAAEDDAESLALWVEVSGTSGDAYSYDMYFQAAADAGPQDWSAERQGLALVVPAESVAKMRGATLDVNPDVNLGGMVIQNPNRPPLPAGASPAMAGPPADLSGDVAQRVLQVLEQQINPGIAAHGGRADLVAVEDDAAYLRLSGGCAGCGMAAVTLSQGIEVALRESVPEILQVIDVTDHAAGTNPYYEAAKK